MNTIAQLKTSNNNQLRILTIPESYSNLTDADMRDNVVDEVRSRGLREVPDVAAMTGLDSTESTKVYVTGVGVYTYSPTGTADGVVTFTTASTGIWKPIALYRQVSDYSAFYALLNHTHSIYSLTGFPAIGGNAGKVLTTDGYSLSWTNPPAVGSGAPVDLEFFVNGLDGHTSITLTGSLGFECRLLRGKLPQPTLDSGDGYYYEKLASSETMTISPALSMGEYIRVSFYKPTGTVTPANN